MRTGVRPLDGVRGNSWLVLENERKSKEKKNGMVTKWALHSFVGSQQPPVPQSSTCEEQGRCPGLREQQPLTSDSRKPLLSAGGTICLNTLHAGTEFTARAPDQAKQSSAPLASRTPA